MFFLVTDTSGKDGSVALAKAGEDRDPKEVEVIESVPLAGGTFSAQLVPQISGLLSKHGLSKSDLGAFVVVSGPGSFTGLRVGLAAIKALAETLGKPIVPVTVLEVLAVGNGTQGKILAALDAGRGEVYLGEYEVADDLVRRGNERILSRTEFLTEALGSGKIEIVVDDPVLAEFTQQAGVAVSRVQAMDAGAIARLGWRKLQAGETVSPEGLEANYIRRSDAEIFAKSSSYLPTSGH